MLDKLKDSLRVAISVAAISNKQKRDHHKASVETLSKDKWLYLSAICQFQSQAPLQDQPNRTKTQKYTAVHTQQGL
jgi:hypothetical protein